MHMIMWADLWGDGLEEVGMKLTQFICYSKVIESKKPNSNNKNLQQLQQQ